MARIVGGIAASHTPTIGFAYDKKKQDDPVWAPIFRNFAPLAEWLAREAARRAAHDLQRPRHVVLLRPLLGVRAGHRARVARGRRRRRGARPASDQGSSQARVPPRAFARGGRVRHVVLPASAAGPRHLLAAVGAGSARARVAGRSHSAGDGRAAVPGPERAAVLQARAGAAPRDRELPRGSQGRDRRHGRVVSPGARRTCRLQQPRVGQPVPRSVRARPRAARRDDARRVRRARRHRRVRRSSCGSRCAARCRRTSSASTGATTCRR